MRVWGLGRTTHRIEDVGALPDVDSLFELKENLHDEMEEERRGRDGPCPGASRVNDVQLRVALNQRAQNQLIHLEIQISGVIARISASSRLSIISCWDRTCPSFTCPLKRHPTFL